MLVFESEKSGKYGVEIRYSIEKKKLQLGIYNTVDEASARYKFMKLEFEELVIDNNAIKEQIYKKSNKNTCLGDGSKRKSSMGVTGNLNPSKGIQKKMKEKTEDETMKNYLRDFVKILLGNEHKILHKLEFSNF